MIYRRWRMLKRPMILKPNIIFDLKIQWMPTTFLLLLLTLTLIHTLRILIMRTIKAMMIMTTKMSKWKIPPPPHRTIHHWVYPHRVRICPIYRTHVVKWWKRCVGRMIVGPRNDKNDWNARRWNVRPRRNNWNDWRISNDRNCKISYNKLRLYWDNSRNNIRNTIQRIR